MSLDLWLFAAYCHQQFTNINDRMDQIMGRVAVDQSVFDNLAATLSSIVAELGSELDTLRTALPDADLSGVDAQVTALQNLEIPNTTTGAAAPETAPPPVAAATDSADTAPPTDPAATTDSTDTPTPDTTTG